MGDPSMGIGDEDVKRIGEYITPRLREMVQEAVHTEVASQPVVVGPQLLERMVRVEEELKSQRELMKERFDFLADRFAFVDRRIEENREASDRRFEQMQKSMDERFTAVDKRFESVDKRFDDVQENFRRTQWFITIGFVLVTAAVTVFGVLA